MRSAWIPAALALLLLPRAALAESPPTFLLAWGSHGTGPYGFSQLMSVAVEASGNVLALDANTGLKRYTSSGSYLQLLATTGVGYTIPHPVDVAAAPGGDLYVIDGFGTGERIVHLGSSGAVIGSWGSHGSGPGQFSYPSGLCADGSGNVYVADSGNLRIQKFSAAGTFLAQWSIQNTNRMPIDVTCGGGQIDVAVTVPGIVETYTLAGAFTGQFSTPLAGEGSQSSASGIAMDPGGELYVMDDFDAVAKKFTPAGALLTSWDGAAHGGFYGVQRLDVDGSGNIYIADTDAYRIQKYGNVAVSGVATTWGRLRSIYR